MDTEKVEFIDITPYLYNTALECKGRAIYVRPAELLRIRCLKIGEEERTINLYYENPDALGCDSYWCFKDSKKTREFLKQFFVLPPSFDETV